MNLLKRLFTAAPPRIMRAPRRSSIISTDPALLAVWTTVRREYFPTLPELDSYTVAWSPRRQRRTLASCHVRKKVVRVAKELRDPLFTQYLPALLYHEMCHAALGEDVGYHRGKRAWHGPRFRTLEQRHPGIRELDAWIKSGGWSYAVRRARALARSR
jgi:hypothetical protein